MKNSNATPKKDTGAKNNNSDNDVDYKNSSRIDKYNSSNVSNNAPAKESK